ncbi:MAG: hypothetical protein OHK0011_07210 [Turneriella sp.]
MHRLSLVALIALFAAHCSKPTIRELDGKIKGKASLRLADGSTISRDDADEYRPQIVTLSDGYLALAFGSDRSDPGCTPGTHNIFLAKSLTPYDGLSLPFFDTPRPLKNAGYCVDDPGRINFAVVPDNTGVKVYLNFHSQSNQIWVAPVTDLENPAPAFGSIGNSNHIDNTVIGANAAGDRLVTTDVSGVAYVMNPNTSLAADAYGFGLNNAESALQVRQEVSGYDDAYLASIYGSSLATTGAFPFGPIFDLDFSLIGSGLFLSSVGAFYSSNAEGDLVLFSAYGEFSEDMYVVTSHTAGDLWNLTGFFGSDVFLPPAPTPAHWYEFTSFSCPSTPPTDSMTASPWHAGSCTGVVLQPNGSYNLTDYADLSGGSAVVDLGSRYVGDAFSISAWVTIPSSGCESTICTIAANASSTNTQTGFRFVYAGNAGGKLQFITGNGGSTFTADSIAINDSMPFNINDSQWHHVAVTVNRTSGLAWLYLDGALVSNSPVILSDFSTGPANLYLGRMSDMNVFLGGMDDVKIFDYELNSNEVLSLFIE